MINNVLVTGATGFVGRHVVSALCNRGLGVVCVVRDQDRASKIPQLTQVQEFIEVGSLSEIEFANNSHEYIVHCAWENVHDTLSVSHFDHVQEQLEFLKASVRYGGAKKIVATGSCYEYGIQYGPVSASQITVPNTPYAIAKDYLHKAFRVICEKHEVELSWARLFYMYGDGQNPRSIVPLFDSAIKRGDRTFDMTLGEQLFDYLPVEDVAAELVRLFDYPGGQYNICSGSPISLRRLLEMRAKELGSNIALNLGRYPYRQQDSMALWGRETLDEQLVAMTR